MHFTTFWSRCKILACKVRASSPLFSSFLPHFFCLAGHLVGFILVERDFRKAFRILGLGERKGSWAMEQDIHGDFQVNVTWFFAFFSCVLDWVVLILIWFERSLHSARVGGQSCPWLWELMTSQVVERTWIRTGGYGWVRGEWVNFEKGKSSQWKFSFTHSGEMGCVRHFPNTFANVGFWLVRKNHWSDTASRQ